MQNSTPTANAIIRTVSAYVVGALLALLISAGIPLDDQEAKASLIAFLALVLGNVYYLAATLLARVWPWAGYLLVIPKAPTYGTGADLLWAFLRTLIPAVIGWLIALGPVREVAEEIGLTDGILATITVSLVASAQTIYYALVKSLETQWPVLAILLGGKPSTAVNLSYAPKHLAV